MKTNQSKKIVVTGIITLSLGMAGWASAAPEDLNIFSKLAKQVVPSVVNLSAISTIQTDFQTDAGMDMFRNFWNDEGPSPFGGRQSRNPRPRQKEVALGTGFIIDPSGILITNNHVVAHADKVEIALTEGSADKIIEGKVIGRDPELDVALIQFKPPRKLNALTLGDSDALEVGEFVMAVGNPYGQGHSVTHGIISAKGREAPEMGMANYLQTDTPINPGNSGGPLLNLRGEVIGINNAIDARAQGISFAIPINFVKKELAQLKTNGRVTRGFIGANIGEVLPEIASKLHVSKDLRAPFVTHVTPGGPASRAGIEPNDVITKIGDTPVHTPGELVLAVTSATVGNSIPVTVSRDGKTKVIQVQIDARPEMEKVSLQQRPQPRHRPGRG